MEARLTSFSVSGAFNRSETLRIRRQLQEEEEEEEVEERVRSASVSGVVAVDQPTADDADTLKEGYNCCTKGLPRWTYRNLFAASFSFMFTFASFLGLQGLQSSLNQQLGVISLSVLYTFAFLGGFVTSAIVRLLSTKYALLFAYLCFTVYTAINFYPEYYTLLPASIIVGIGTGPIWAAVSIHLGIVALRFTESPNVSESFDRLVTKFNGILFFSFHLASILSNSVSSLVLFPYNRFAQNGTAQLGDVCDNMEARNVTDTQQYILLSTYLVFNALGILILLVFVSKISLEANSNQMNRCRRYCSLPFTDLMKVLISWKMILLGPLSVYNGAQLSYAFSSYTANVVSMCVGVSKVGFTLIVLGFFSATTSVIYARLVKYIHRVFFAIFATIINLFFLLFLQFYPLHPSYALVFLFVIFWGIAGGIWNTLNSSLVAILFPEHQDSAYTAFRIWIGLGFAIGFSITELQSFSNRIWTMIALLILTITSYLLLEVFTSKFGQKTCCYKDLGVFDGPKTKYDLNSNKEELTEDMLDVNVGEYDKSNHSSYSKSQSYLPPSTSRSRAVSDHGVESKLNAELESRSLTSNGVGKAEGSTEEQKKRLLQSAVF